MDERKLIEPKRPPAQTKNAGRETSKEKLKDEKIEELKTLLDRNHNIILHGAPGTGKTYLAKEIAKAMECSDDEIGFVQFHQSYDYTDFVEGLRPVYKDKGQIGFERKDGIFKTFCKKALKSRNNEEANNITNDIDDFIEKSIREKTRFKLYRGNKGNNEIWFRKDGDAIKACTPMRQEYSVPEEYIKLVLSDSRKFERPRDIINFINEKMSKNLKTDNESSYLWALDNVYKEKKSQNGFVKAKKTFVFIIDEINRGEMSKIFGELFFSIDPEYRGTKGKVRTQYANLQEKPNDFDKALGIEQNESNKDNYGHFFVPDNVYIIGTMNDIDRSVDCMDFAMRRRFAFKEITAKDRVEMLNELSNNKDEAERRMNSLNEAIEKIPGLSAAYHVGPAYFLKLKNYNYNFDKLWEYHIEGVVKEYLRGMDSANEKLEKLANAYKLR